jgi:transcription-repair coupling factor (superfamily II helicase)
LTLTATPIPRTLQSAMVGLQSLSVIATPPTRRVAIRTVLLPYDPALAREALHHEKRRGGQSFVVCPRIEDIEPMTARLNEIVPKLKVRVAHGKMPADDIDDTMVQFADGDGDVLLATNIIESGLDLPRANTMLIWRPDRFGIAQLHQLRGRVGRGNRAGITYLFTDPETGMSAATEKRLRAFESLNRLGAGFAISARDMDLRGAGDLLGEQQTGHVKLIGIDLYRHMLERALAAARGEKLDSDWSPELRLDFSGLIPADYVPEPEVRIGLYARLARLHAMADIEAFDDEIADRFGEPPEAVQKFLGIARVRQLCRRLDVARVDCGPQALALTFRAPVQARRTLQRTVEASGDKLRWHDERLISARTDAHADGYRFVLDVLQRLA